MVFQDSRREATRPRNSLDIGNATTFKNLKGVHPKYAKHMFLQNKVIEQFAANTFGGIDILEQPVCRSCEKPCAWNVNDTAYCFSCGTTTKEPITVREYLRQELKIDTSQLEMMELEGRMEDDRIIIK